jgi:hypothetical protein
MGCLGCAASSGAHLIFAGCILYRKDRCTASLDLPPLLIKLSSQVLQANNRQASKQLAPTI